MRVIDHAQPSLRRLVVARVEHHQPVVAVGDLDELVELRVRDLLPDSQHLRVGAEDVVTVVGLMVNVPRDRGQRHARREETVRVLEHVLDRGVVRGGFGAPSQRPTGGIVVPSEHAPAPEPGERRCKAGDRRGFAHTALAVHDRDPLDLWPVARHEPLSRGHLFLVRRGLHAQRATPPVRLNRRCGLGDDE